VFFRVSSEEVKQQGDPEPFSQATMFCLEQAWAACQPRQKVLETSSQQKKLGMVMPTCHPTYCKKHE
jgi:hypothetical protein